LYRIFLGKVCDPRDKRLTHSLLGILITGTSAASCTLIPVFLLGGTAALYPALAFVCGLMLGQIMHLCEDLCTRKGITPLFPFSSLTISGSIRPCDTADRRIAQFHLHSCSVAGLLLGIHFLGGYGITPALLCLFGLGSCLGMMIWSSDVAIVRDSFSDRSPEISLPPPTDPFVSQWKTDYPEAGLQMSVYYFNKRDTDNYRKL
jgi:hypothetical protein